MTVRIAAATEDRQGISNHFGRAPFYRVLTVEGMQVTADEVRSKAFHGAQEPHHSAEGHLHADMFAPIADCQVLIAGGMGEPAFQNARELGLEVILAGEPNIRKALSAYQGGQLESDPRRIHNHY